MRFFQIMLCLFITSPMWAQIQEKNIKTDIDEVRVYLQGAEIIRTQDLNLPIGKYRLIFTGLSPRLDARSVQVTTSDNTSLLSLTSKTNFLSPKLPSVRVKEIQDSVTLMNMEKQDLSNIKRAFQKEEEVIQRNQDLKSVERGLTTEELIKVSNFYRARFREIYKEKTKIDREMTVLTLKVNQLNSQLSQMNANNQPTSEVYLEVNVKSSAKTKVKVRYLVASAGWSPVYDLKAGKLNEPINLKYRALAYNNTGVDWEDVDITLSNADPYQSASKPILNPWRLNAYALASRNNFAQSQGRLNSGQILNNSLEFDADGRLDANAARPTRPSDAGGIRMEQIEISELNKDFEIKDKYTIPSDSKPYSIDIETHKLDANYLHFAVPKMDKDAFLLAQVTGWEELNLIDGPMNVYHGENFIGQASLDTRTLNDTLDLSLGRDKNVIITRVKQKEQSKKQFFGSDKKVTLAYKIDVKNNHNQPINLEIQDQIPISSEKDIVVTLINKNKADYTEASGKLTWIMKNIPSGGRKTVDFSYSIKHPKGKPIQLEKKRSQWVPRY